MIATTTHKRVLVRTLARKQQAGYLDPNELSAAEMELLSPEGTLYRLSRPDIQAIYFVKDFACSSLLEKSPAIERRPRGPGLWVRLRCRDQRWIEAILPNDLLSLAGDLNLVPLGMEEFCPRVYIPRQAILEFQVREVLQPPQRRRRALDRPAPETQMDLFGQPE